MKDYLFLDAEADGGNEAVTTFSDRFQDLIKDFLLWVKERNITSDRLDYASIFRCINKHKGVRIVNITLKDEGCILTPLENIKKRTHLK